MLRDEVALCGWFLCPEPSAYPRISRKTNTSDLFQLESWKLQEACYEKNNVM